MEFETIRIEKRTIHSRMHYVEMLAWDAAREQRWGDFSIFHAQWKVHASYLEEDGEHVDNPFHKLSVAVVEKRNEVKNGE